jgi:hypothetical protein
MAINNRNYLKSAITDTTVVYNPTEPGIQATLIGLLISNTTSTSVTATVTLTSGTTTASIVTNVSIPPSTSLNVIDSNRLVVAQNNSIAVTSSGLVDVIVSTIEVT